MATPAGGVTDLAVRPLEDRDFEACLSLLRGGLAYPDDLLASLPRAWRGLLHDHALNAVVVEAQRVDGTTVIAGLGASVFVTDAWMADASRGTEPYLTARTIRAELGPDSPVLRPAEIVSANEAGLNVLVLHYGESDDLPDDVLQPLRYRLFEAFVETHRGYRIAAVLQEFWDEMAPEFVLNGWGRVRSDYTDFLESRDGPALPPGRRPYLIGITRDEVAANPGAIAAPLFLYAAPRLELTPGEKRLLRHALEGHTDVELASRLGISVATVKSRWRGIHQRVARRAPELLADTVQPERPESVRGPEKRRRILAYLHRHPEELRS